MTARTGHIDVAVAGGGLIGLATAWYLCEAGCRVAVLDAGPIGRQASWAGGGILFPIYPWKYPSTVQRLAQRGRVIYDDFTRRVDACSGIDSENRRTGLCVFDAGEFEAGMRWAHRHGEAAQIVDQRRLSTVQPGLNVPAVLHFPNAAQVRNPRLCQSLKRALQARGAWIMENRSVTSIREAYGRFVGFETPAGAINADRGVVACGAWSSRVLGERAPRPVFPVKGQMILLKGELGLLGPVLLDQGRYVIPRADGRILVGSTLEHAGFDQTPSPVTAKRLHEIAAGMMPMLGQLPLERQWAGLRPATSDEVPLTGAVDGVDGLYVNTGHYRNGVVCAPASAERLLDCMDTPCGTGARSLRPPETG